jgi:hypothetical protein
MREKIEGLKQEREMNYMHITQLEKQVETLGEANAKLVS